jgi:hypothetical protein
MGSALDFTLHLSRLFQSALKGACHSNTRIRLMLYFPNAYLIIARASVALFLKFAQPFLVFLCRIDCEIASGQIHDPK